MIGSGKKPLFTFIVTYQHGTETNPLLGQGLGAGDSP